MSRGYENTEDRERQPPLFPPRISPGWKTSACPVISPFLFLSGGRVCSRTERCRAGSTYHCLGPSQRGAVQAAGEAGGGRREAGTETRLTFNRSNTIETVLSTLNEAQITPKFPPRKHRGEEAIYNVRPLKSRRENPVSHRSLFCHMMAWRPLAPRLGRAPETDSKPAVQKLGPSVR